MEYTEKQLQEFREELLHLPSAEQKALFYGCLKKKAKDLSELEIRALIAKVNFLTDDGRYKFREVLVEENVTAEERKRWMALYPRRTDFGKQVSPSFFNKFFPKRDDVTEHYKINFTNGRK